MEEFAEELSKVIKRKNLERELGEIFYKMCPNVPPQILATSVRQTIFMVAKNKYKKGIVILIKKVYNNIKKKERKNGEKI